MLQIIFPLLENSPPLASALQHPEYLPPRQERQTPGAHLDHPSPINLMPGQETHEAKVPAGPFGKTLRSHRGSQEATSSPVTHLKTSKRVTVFHEESGPQHRCQQWTALPLRVIYKHLVRLLPGALWLVRVCAKMSAVPAEGGSWEQKTKGRKRLAFLTLCWQ